MDQVPRLQITPSVSSAQSVLLVAEQLISPSDVLLSHGKEKYPRGAAPPSTLTYLSPMDKRHPSSFQQLEKVPYIYVPLKPIHLS